MNITRMKFAYARGACIQYRHLHPDGERCWINTAFVSAGLELRIHPDDAHLEYGPLSSALRKHATAPRQDTSRIYSDMWGMQVRLHLWEGMHCYIEADDKGFDLSTDNWRMYLLFLAELLADEGL